MTNREHKTEADDHDAHDHYETARDLPRFIAKALERRFGDSVEALANVLREDLRFKIRERRSAHYVVDQEIRRTSFADYDAEPRADYVTTRLVPERREMWLQITAKTLRAMAGELDDAVSPLSPIAMLVLGTGDRIADAQRARDEIALAIIDLYLEPILHKARAAVDSRDDRI